MQKDMCRVNCPCCLSVIKNLIWHCALFLFLYTDNLSLEFHLKSIEELYRVSKEVRIFPLLNVNAYRSSYVEPVIKFLRERKRHVKEIKVAYEFQKGGNTMLRIC